MFAVFKLQYLSQYTIHFKLSNTLYESSTSNRIHTFITHISEVDKDPKTRCQIVEQKSQQSKCPYFFVMFQLLTLGNLR